jgi:hypothetical protein
MEAEKPNGKSGYRQNRELGVICVLWLVMVFFRLDSLIGAVGLRQYYWLCGGVTTALLIWCSVVYFILWQEGKLRFVYSFVLTAVALGLLVIGAWVFVAFLGAALVWLMPIWVLPLGLIVSLIMWGWNSLQHDVFTPIVVRIIFLLLILFAAVYVIGAASGLATGYAVDGSVSVGDYHYFLTHPTAGEPLGNETVVTLYECNSLAIFCHDVQSFRVPRQELGSVALHSVSSGSRVEVIISNEAYFYPVLP